MLVTKQNVLKRFWYPVIPVGHLADGPKPFRLLGQDIVVWLDAAGQPSAVEDRCCHRSAKLSRGFLENGQLVCGYHGWTFDGTGAVVKIPQQRNQTRKVNYSIPSYKASVKYGHVWVCLGEPLADIPHFEEADAPGFRQIDQFYEVWNCAGLRLMENSFDNAHVAYVHRETFGNVQEPLPATYDINETDYGFEFKSEIPVMNRSDLATSITGTTGARTVRITQSKWFMPFTRKLGITYPSGTKHSIVTSATPIDDTSSQIVQFVFRNDTEEQAKAADIIEFDRRVTDEDRPILESTEPDVSLDIRSGTEFHMPSDKPGLVMRRRMLELLRQHGETDITSVVAPSFQGSVQAAE